MLPTQDTGTAVAAATAATAAAAAASVTQTVNPQATPSAPLQPVMPQYQVPIQPYFAPQFYPQEGIPVAGFQPWQPQPQPQPATAACVTVPASTTAPPPRDPQIVVQTGGDQRPNAVPEANTNANGSVCVDGTGKWSVLPRDGLCL